jgi:hypothetical protein
MSRENYGNSLMIDRTASLTRTASFSAGSGSTAALPRQTEQDGRMNRTAAILCLLVGLIFAALAGLVLLTKFTSPDVRGVLVLAAFGLASFGCYRAASRLWRTPVPKANRADDF